MGQLAVATVSVLDPLLGSPLLTFVTELGIAIATALRVASYFIPA